MTAKEFEEIAHTGGQVTFHVVTSPEGRRGYQVGFHHQRPVASALFAVYALPQGIVVAPLPMGGIGSPWPPPPVPGCFPVFIASDSEGMFGHKCPECSNYWRARFSSSVCPYCGFHGNVQDFLTDAQRRYVHQYCELLQNALTSEQDGDHVIDMDAVARRQKLLASQNLVAGLGIPLKRRPDAASTYTAREIKRKLGPKMPPATAGAFKPEPVLEESEYQHILDVLEGMVKVMERSPKAFHNIDEETLRTHFLVQLNGHYEGQATGETFNYQGKTDILIRSGDRNVFIAECKFWGGPAKLTGTIDQLLGYLSWRDSKAAILVFNRNREFSKVLGTIPDVVTAHPNFAKDEGRRGGSGFRYAFRHKDDPVKILHLTVMAFDIPSAATEINRSP